MGYLASHFTLVILYPGLTINPVVMTGPIKHNIVPLNLHNPSLADSAMSGFLSENYHPFAHLIHFKDTSLGDSACTE